MQSYSFTELKGQHVLLDTDVLITVSKYAESGSVQSLVGQFKELPINPVITQGVYFEYVRAANSKDSLNKMKDFLFEEVSAILLPHHKNDLSNAVDIANLYQRYSKKMGGTCNASMVDCLNSAQLMRYGKNLTPLSFDIKGYPTLIHNRVGLYPLDLENITNDTKTLATIRFSEKKYHELRESF